MKRLFSTFSQLLHLCVSLSSSSSFSSSPDTVMENLLGLLRIRVIRGVNLAVRDLRSSDPYIFFTMGKQKLRTSVIKRNLNPEWNEDLTLCIEDPNVPIKLAVYDHDTFTFDDKMGEAEFDIKPFIEVVKMHLEGIPSDTIITRVLPTRENCLCEESRVMLKNNKVVQDLCLRLKNVESGEIELQLQWIDVPGSRHV